MNQNQNTANSAAQANRNESIRNILKESNAQRIKTDLAEIYTMKEFLDKDFCEKIIKSCQPHFIRSTVSTERGGAISQYRTSSTCKLDLCIPRAAKQIEDKISIFLQGLTGPEDESLQIQRYRSGQFYREHFDWFAPWSKEYKYFTDTIGQRTWTIMIYLNKVPEGGETKFRYLNQTFKPNSGMAVIWNNLKKDGQPNPYTLHEAKPVLKESKWVLTKWLRHG